MFFMLLVLDKECAFFGGFDNPIVFDISRALIYADVKSLPAQVERILTKCPSVKLCVPISFETVSNVFLRDFYRFFGGVIK